MDWLSVVPWSGLGWGGLIFAAVFEPKEATRG